MSIEPSGAEGSLTVIESALTVLLTGAAVTVGISFDLLPPVLRFTLPDLPSPSHLEDQSHFVQSRLFMPKILLVD